MQAAILCHKRGVTVCAKDVHAQAVAWYNLGWTEYRAHVCTGSQDFKSSPYLQASVRCFKRAIELEARNPEFWDALGIVTTHLNAKVAQHAFIRSLYISDKPARVWTNLGTLYTIQDDTQLANEAFTRAQSADPDYGEAWLGQGVLALLLGDKQEAHQLFTHAFEISDSSMPITRRLYAVSIFDQICAGKGKHELAALLQPLFALHQLRTQAPMDIVSHHLLSHLAERVGDRVEQIKVLEQVCSKVEVDYEQTESAGSLNRFAQAKADLGRAYLAEAKFTEALENATVTIDLSADEETERPDRSARHAYRLSAHLTAGLANYYLGAFDDSIAMFRDALAESDSNPDVACILAQVLWAKGSSQEREIAREQLFDCIEKHPAHAGAIMLLMVIALLDDDRDTIDAVTSDLHGLRTRDDLDEGQKRELSRLLEASARLQDPSGNKELAEAKASVMLAPHEPYGWAQLADAADQNECPARMALLTAMGAVPPKGSLRAEDLAAAYTGTHTTADAQRAIMLAPWMRAGWREIAEGISE